MPPGFCRYKVRIPYSSQTFTVLPTKYVGATFIIAPGTSLRSLANVTLKAQQNMQFCTRSGSDDGGGSEAVAGYRTAHEGLPYPPRIFTVPLGKCSAKISCKSSTNVVGFGFALYVEVLLNVLVVYKQEF
jgi:hypothetical protein